MTAPIQPGDRVVTPYGTGKVALVPPMGCVFVDTDSGAKRLCLPWDVKVIDRDTRGVVEKNMAVWCMRQTERRRRPSTTGTLRIGSRVLTPIGTGNVVDHGSSIELDITLVRLDCDARNMCTEFRREEVKVMADR